MEIKALFEISTLTPIILLYSRNKKESSGKYLLCISIKQRIDNMYTQVAIHASTIGSLAVSQFFPPSLADC